MISHTISDGEPFNHAPEGLTKTSHFLADFVFSLSRRAFYTAVFTSVGPDKVYLGRCNGFFYFFFIKQVKMQLLRSPNTTSFTL